MPIKRGLPFDIEIAYQCALAAMAAYDPQPGDVVIDNKALDIRAILRVTADGDIIVGFRGTANWRNWLTDIHCYQCYTAQGRVHAGCYNAVAALSVQIQRALTFLEHSDPLAPRTGRMFVTGHSLGGGMAVEYARRYPDTVNGIFTFGQLRLGDKEFRGWFNGSGLAQKTWRFVNKQDIVPHCPLIDYRHCGNLGYFDDFGGFLINPTWRAQAANNVIGLSSDLYRLWSGRIPDWVAIREHSMHYYLADISQLRVKNSRSLTSAVSAGA